ncbi:hypothetical protein H0H87_012376 [Tephrocybe sp. NHM501043]|nr:hypothetical protein H0H87_012376 [Tephrocybe sp. NHM501043]
MSEFLRGPPSHDNPGTITGALMAQYLMALLGHRTGDDMGFGDLAGQGRMGDYVFNQEALDQIITQLMNESNAHRPVPATEEIVANLPRERLVLKSPMLDKDCAVCKEQFQLETDDPAEQTVITLPCKHPFHEPCILPWLKSSGTCPVCRYALVPQPDQHPANAAPEAPLGRDQPGRLLSAQTRSPAQSNNEGTIGILQSLFGGFLLEAQPFKFRPIVTIKK